MYRLHAIWQLHPVDSVKGQADLLAWFPELLGEDIGTMKNVKASIHVIPYAKPVFCEAISVPYLIKSKLDDELDRLL